MTPTDPMQALSPAALALGLSNQLTKQLEDQALERKKKLQAAIGPFSTAASALLPGNTGAPSLGV